MNAQTNIGLEGRLLTAQILDKNGKIVKRIKYNKKNTILNSGLDLVGRSSGLANFSELFRYCHGGGNGSATSLTQTRLNSYEHTSAIGYSLVVLQDPVDRNKIHFTFTYDFPLRTTDFTYREFGWGATSSQGAGAANDLFSRITPTAVTVLTDNKLRLSYKVTVTLSKTTAQINPTALVPAAPFSGSTSWNTSGTHQHVGNFTSDLWNEFLGNNPPNPSTRRSNLNAFSTSRSLFCVLISGAVTIPTWGVNGTGSNTLGGGTTIFSKTMTTATYVNGTYTSNSTVTFTETEGNSASIGGVYIGGLLYRFSNLQAKTNEERLILNHRLTWGRV